MSYDVELRDALTKETLQTDMPHFMCGGTYAVGGTHELWLNITFNYGPLFRKAVPEGIYAIDGMSAVESIAVLDKMIAVLDDDVDDDYWKPTEGNAKRALLQLKAMAQMRPDGEWKVWA